MAGKGSAPGERRGGRQKGSPNHMTTEIKDMVRGALNAAGGQTYLVKQAKDNPSAFMTLIGKIIPADVNAKLSGKAELFVHVTNGSIED